VSRETSDHELTRGTHLYQENHDESSDE